MQVSLISKCLNGRLDHPATYLTYYSELLKAYTKVLYVVGSSVDLFKIHKTIRLTNWLSSICQITIQLIILLLFDKCTHLLKYSVVLIERIVSCYPYSIICTGT